MKKIIIFGLIAALCLALVACSPSSGKDKAEDSAPASSDAAAEVYTFTYRDVKIALGDEVAPIVKKLGEPKKYFESQSCAFQGLDKVYTYSGVVIRTFPKDKVDYVLSVEFKDDTVATEEGIAIGDTREKVEKAYGKAASSGSAVTYSKGGVSISIIYGEDGNVSSITYTLDNQSTSNN